MVARERACDCCGELDFEPTRWVNVLGLGVSLVRCRACGVKCYAHYARAAEEVNDSEAAHANADLTCRFGAMDNRDPSRVAEFRAAHVSYYGGMLRMLHALTEPPPLAKLYEVGTGVGEFLTLARASGILFVAGCDPNRRAAELAAEASGAHVEAAFFRAARIPTTPLPVDAVVMLDVLEHTETPRTDLLRAHSMLRPGGVLLLKTFYDEWHDTQSVDLSQPYPGAAGRTGYFDPLGHLHHFDEPVLRALVERCGFSIVAWERDTAYGQITCYARPR